MVYGESRRYDGSRPQSYLHFAFDIHFFLRKLCIYNYLNILPAKTCFMQISMASELSILLNWLYLNWLIEYIQIFMKQQLPTAIDLSKAFDTIDHTILICKREHYGVENNELQWFISYMHNRHNYVQIENIKSTTETINYRSPSKINFWSAAFLNIHLMT